MTIRQSIGFALYAIGILGGLLTACFNQPGFSVVLFLLAFVMIGFFWAIDYEGSSEHI